MRKSALIIFAALAVLAALGAVVYALPWALECTLLKKYMPAAAQESKLVRLG